MSELSNRPGKYPSIRHVLPWMWAVGVVVVLALGVGLGLTLGRARPAPPTAAAIPPTTPATATSTPFPPTNTPPPRTATPVPAVYTPIVPAVYTPIAPALTPGAIVTQTREKDGMIMVYVPAGDFLMGSADADSRAADEKPQHIVTLDAYWIDQTEVTNAQYHWCVEAGVCGRAGSGSFTRNSYYDAVGYDDYPVISVGWLGAQAYCQWVGARLPTEAEWEKAARGTDGRKYPWGNDDPDCYKANYGGAEGGCLGDTTKVGSYPAGASPYGALDMAGNVWEWVADWYEAGYYSHSPAADPKGPNSDVPYWLSSRGDLKVQRGGSWGSGDNWIRTAVRNWCTPNGGQYVGFRCSMTATSRP